MPDRYTRFLNLLFSETGGDADFKSWLQLPVFIFATAWADWHALEPSDQNAAGKSLSMYEQGT